MDAQDSLTIEVRRTAKAWLSIAQHGGFKALASNNLSI